MACLHARSMRVVGRLLARLSPRATVRLGRLLSRIPMLNARRRRIAAANIAACFPALDAAGRRDLVARTLASNTTGVLETLQAWFAPPGRLAGRARIDGLEHLHAALADGHGAVLVCAHYDGVELAGRHVAEASGVRMVALVRRYNDPCIEAEVSAGRSSYGGATYDKKDIAGFADEVRAGHAAFYVPDQDAARRTVFVPFFGVQAATLGAIGGVLRRSGGRVLLMWCHREDDGRQRIALQPAPAAWPCDDDAATAAGYMAWVESCVRQAPEQYLWVHRRFKTRPPGEPPFYR